MAARQLGDYILQKVLPAPTLHHRIALAKHCDDGEDIEPGYVVKFLALSDNDAHATLLRSQFEHEAFVMGHLYHESIPTLFAHGEDQGLAYLVMDYVDGCNLAELLGHGTSAPQGLPTEVAVYLIAQIASALQHMHHFECCDENDQDRVLCILHRDICPTNIMISRHGDVYLIDFGSAWSDYLAPEARDLNAGHIAYKAPERLLEHGQASPQSDLFSLAIILWELLRGERCFAGETQAKTIESIARFDINHSQRKVPGLSPKLSEVLRKNLDRDPSRRYSSAFQVLQRLAQSPEAKEAASARQQLAQMVSARIQSKAAAS